MKRVVLIVLAVLLARAIVLSLLETAEWAVEGGEG